MKTLFNKLMKPFEWALILILASAEHLINTNLKTVKKTDDFRK